jgi:hypothetical protein
MAATDYPLIRGMVPDSSSYEINWNIPGVSVPADLKGVTGFDWKISKSSDHSYGKGAQPLGNKRGQYSYEASFTVKKADWKAWRTAVGSGYFEAVGDAVITWLEGDFEDSVQWLGFTLTEVGESVGAGDEPEVTVACKPVRIVEGNETPDGA